MKEKEQVLNKGEPTLFTTSEAGLIVTKETGTAGTDFEVFARWVLLIMVDRKILVTQPGKRYRYTQKGILTEGEDFIKKGGRYYITPSGISKLIRERSLQLQAFSKRKIPRRHRLQRIG